ncbi:MAG TPA: N-acetylmuramoyl-L-alanine amidase [Usitatibacter sp.]|nr:N-acetylmuramoyl-L-alanine amidase [Usitatibacter sp.]
MKKTALACLATLWLGGCASGPPIDTTYRSVGQDSRVMFLVLHFTNESFASSLETLTQGRVSSHYLVDEKPPIVYRLVEEERRAWHAGLSSWKGYTQINASSVGIEIVNLGLRGPLEDPSSFADFPGEQIDTVIELSRAIVKRHGIKPEHVVGHSDIAPQRKVDPGPKFPWKRFADAGLIHWPKEETVAARRPAFEASLPDVSWFQLRLAQHGFAVPMHGDLDMPTRNVLRAFQMKYRPARYDGTPDAETAALLDALVNP